MKKLKAVIITGILSMGLVGQVDAGFVTTHINSLVPFAGGYIHFAIDTPTATTCNHWGYQFRFNGATEGGKNMYHALTVAKALNKQISIGFSDSTAPGTDSNSGCTTSAMSTLVHVAY